MDQSRLCALLDPFPRHTVLVVGDYFLDKYLEIDPALSEPSLETGLEAYQVVGVRSSPGAAGTVVNNLRALDVNVVALSVVGEDGEAADLRRGLASNGVDLSGLISAPGRFTPTYLKPMWGFGGVARELNRIDTKNRRPQPAEIEDQVIAVLEGLAPRAQAVVICDQVSQLNCGVITERVRAAVSRLAAAHPQIVFVADSRERIGLYRNVMLKPNAREARRATGLDKLAAAGEALRRSAGRPVVVTDGDQGAYVFSAEGQQHVPAITVTGPLDIVGAGDSAMAGIVSALCGGASPAEAALMGNLVASLTIQQLGTTGTASREQVMERFEEAAGRT
jgi:rfaE bifunctional protein kinase chain/domain